MFSRISRHSTKWLTLQVERTLFPLSRREGESLSVDVNLLSLVSPPGLSWTHFSGLCQRNIVPLYRNLKNTIEEDVEHVARLISELDATTTPCPTKQDILRTPATHSDADRVRRKRRRPSVISERRVVHASDPSAPTIIVTPCVDGPRETSCWVPYQDAAFGMRLTVPTHAAFNSTDAPVAGVERRFVDGRWHAVLPSPEEQCRRGLYSRPVSARTRPRSRCTPFRTADVDESMCGVES